MRKFNILVTGYVSMIFITIMIITRTDPRPVDVTSYDQQEEDQPLAKVSF